MIGKVRVLDVGEKPESGVWPMPDLPYAVRAVVSVAIGHRLADEHVCEWPDGIKPDKALHVEHCNCGAYIDFAQQVVATLGLVGDADLTGVVADLTSRLRLAEQMERVAARHAMQKDVEVAEADANVARMRSEVAELRAVAASRDFELRGASEKADRFGKALQVCEHTVHLVAPTQADLAAAQQASGAYCTDWQPEHVHDDLPDFEYRQEGL